MTEQKASDTEQQDTTYLSEAVMERIEERYGRTEYESWGLDKRAEITGMVRDEVQQADRVIGAFLRTHYEQKGAEGERQRIEAALLEVDGPVLLALREEFGTQVMSNGWGDEENEPLHANGADVEKAGDDLSDHVRDAISLFFAALSEKETDQPGEES